MQWKDLEGIDFRGWFIHEIDGGREYVARIKSLQDGTAKQDRCFVRQIGLESETGLSIEAGEWSGTPPSNQSWGINSDVYPINDNANKFGYQISLGQFGYFMLFPPDRYPELQRLFSSPRSVFEGPIAESVEITGELITIVPSKEARNLFLDYTEEDKEELVDLLTEALTESLRATTKKR
jgi:hypothetical protein